MWRKNNRVRKKSGWRCFSASGKCRGIDAFLNVAFTCTQQGKNIRRSDEPESGCTACAGWRKNGCPRLDGDLNLPQRIEKRKWKIRKYPGITHSWWIQIKIRCIFWQIQTRLKSAHIWIKGGTAETVAKGSSDACAFCEFACTRAQNNVWKSWDIREKWGL